MDKWEGGVAVVTGASAGIGKAIATKLADHGMTVAALARRIDRLQELSASYKGKGSIKAYKCDVSKSSDIENVFAQIGKDLGRVRVLVNNAGIAINTSTTAFDIEKWRQMFDINVFGMFSCIKQVVNSVKANNDGKLVHIININSVAGHMITGEDNILVYSTSKHCVTWLSRGVQKQLTNEKIKNIKVTSLSPGVVDTEIFEKGGWELAGKIDHIAHLTPENVAKGVVSALSFPPEVLISELTMKPMGELF